MESCGDARKQYRNAPKSPRSFGRWQFCAHPTCLVLYVGNYWQLKKFSKKVASVIDCLERICLWIKCEAQGIVVVRRFSPNGGAAVEVHFRVWWRCCRNVVPNPQVACFWQNHIALALFGPRSPQISLSRRRLGFSGLYVIMDLPAVSAIQEYYLRATGLSHVLQISQKPLLDRVGFLRLVAFLVRHQSHHPLLSSDPEKNIILGPGIC